MRLAHHGLLIVTLALSGCAPQTQHISETLSVALFGVSDERATADYAESLPYASLFVSLDNAPHALLILAWAEEGQHDPLALKWVSAQQELIVTEVGRITKTVNLVVGNIQHFYASEPDPLSLNLLLANTPKTWHYQLSWQDRQQQQHQQPATSTFIVHQQQEKTLPNGVQSLIWVEENVSLPLIKQSYSNHYWLDPTNGKVVASEQRLGPTGSQLALSIAKPFSGE